MKNKFLLIVLAMLVVVTLIAGAGVGIWTLMDRMDNKTVDPGQKAANSVEHVEGKKQSAAEVKKLTVSVENVITNLKERDRTIKAGFAFEMNNSKVKKELEDYDSRVRNVINQTLADLTMEDLSGSKGQEALKAILMNKINDFLTTGKVTQVNITDIIMQ
ncbi:flagellar basal body-associated FliL family protein [Gorillibacterium massiliense]|uniref:flagellar basal body-associated FliL family protein n=1 Tax=Gorillibacterium massiliense TaxID=1280390 RepID=UPI0004AEE631|nr:flagellar basal body-associated FliL family protein [Gorillibacterium massiliense]